jgi:hypothetical protein
LPEFDLLGDPVTETEEKRGRPQHSPEERQRLTVQALAGYGIPQPEIAYIVGIDPTTLRERYRAELDRGRAVANANVAKNLYAIAIGTGREAVTAGMFWLRCRAGWSEFAPVQAEPKPASLGKKDAQALAAETADQGTGWAGLVH